MRAQAARFGPAELSRAADLVNAGLTEMRGATAPRLLLELICARVLLPGAGPAADNDAFRDLTVRLDRIERQVMAGAPIAAAPAAPVKPPPAASAPAAARTEAPLPPQPTRPAEPAPAAREPAPPPVAPPAAREPAPPPVAPPAAQPAAASAPTAAASAGDVATLRRFWPDILNEVKTSRRFTWMLLMNKVQIASLDADTLVLAFADEGQRKNFLTGNNVDELAAAIQKVMRTSWRIDAVLDPERARDTAPPPAGPSHSTTAPPPAAAPAAASKPTPRSAPVAAAPPATVDDEAHPDDETMDGSDLSGRDLLVREFGATVLEEIQHD